MSKSQFCAWVAALHDCDLASRSSVTAEERAHVPALGPRIHTPKILSVSLHVSTFTKPTKCMLTNNSYVPEGEFKQASHTRVYKKKIRHSQASELPSKHTDVHSIYCMCKRHQPVRTQRSCTQFELRTTSDPHRSFSPSAYNGARIHSFSSSSSSGLKRPTIRVACCARPTVSSKREGSTLVHHALSFQLRVLTHT